MPHIPILLICGNAGAGKSTAAAAAVMARPGSVVVNIADPIKRVCRDVFEFSEETLWGPSAARSVPDLKYDFQDAWEEARKNMYRLNHIPPAAIQQWFNTLYFEHISLREQVTSIGTIKTIKIVKELLTPRQALQTYGAYCRKIYPDIWTNEAITVASRLLGGDHSYTPSQGLQEVTGAPPVPWVIIGDGRTPNEPLAVAREGGAVVLIVNAEATMEDEHSTEQVYKIPLNRFDTVIFNHKKNHTELNNMMAAILDKLEHPIFPYQTCR